MAKDLHILREPWPVSVGLNKEKEQTVSINYLDGTSFEIPKTLITLVVFCEEVLQERRKRGDDMDYRELTDLLESDPNGFLKKIAQEMTDEFYHRNSTDR